MLIPTESVIFKSVVTLLEYPFSQIIWKLLRIWTNAIKKEKNLKLLKPEPCKDEVEKHDRDRKGHPRGECQSREGTKVLKKEEKWVLTIDGKLEGGKATLLRISGTTRFGGDPVTTPVPPGQGCL